MSGIVFTVLFPGVLPLSSGMKVRFGRGPLALLIVIGLLFVLISVLPAVFQMTDGVQPYRGIRILPTGADTFRAVQVREVVDGYTSLGNPYFATGKNEPALRPVAAEQLVGLLARALPIDALGTLFFFQAFVVFLLTIVLGVFVFSVTNRPWIAVIATAVALFMSPLLSAPWDIVHFLQPMQSQFFFLRFTFDFDMQWAFLWLLVMLTAVSEWMQTSRRKWLMAATLSFLILVYSSDTAAAFGLITMLMLSIIVLWQRDLKRLADIAAFWMIVLLLSTPQLIHIYVLSEHQWYTESMARFGLVMSHGPLLTGVWLGAFVAIGLFSRHIWPRTWPLVLVLAASAVLALNQQALTGFALLPHRYHWLIVQPLASVFAVSLALLLVTRIASGHRLQRFGGILLIIIALVVAVMQQWGAYRSSSLLWGRMQQAAPAITYIADTLEPGQTVYSQDQDILDVIPAFTSADVLSSSQGGAALVSTDRLRHAYFFDLWLAGLRPEEAQATFTSSKRVELAQKIYGLAYREESGAYDAIPDGEIEKEAELYRNYVRLSMREKLLFTPVSAVITTPYDTTTPVWTTFLRCSKAVLSSGGYEVRIMKPATDATSCMR